MLTPPQRHHLIEKFRALPDQVAQLIAGLTAEQLTMPYLDGEWTVAQNVHHLLDSHMNSYIRCKLIATEGNPPLKPYDQDLWAAFPDAQAADISGSLALLRNLHARWIVFWEQLPDEAWRRTGVHQSDGVVSLEDMLRLYVVAHGEAHIDQITRLLAARA